MGRADGFVITTAGPEDLPAILELQRLAFQGEAELYGDFGIPPLTQTLEEMSAEMERRVFLKAVDGGGLAGSVRGHVDEGGACHLGRLMVHPRARGRGLGTRLSLELEARFPEAARFELFTGHKSEGNLRLYRRLGYREFKTLPVHERLTMVFLEKPGQ